MTGKQWLALSLTIVLTSKWVARETVVAVHLSFSPGLMHVQRSRGRTTRGATDETAHVQMLFM